MIQKTGFPLENHIEYKKRKVDFDQPFQLNTDSILVLLFSGN